MKCCAECFGDRVLQAHIIRALSTDTGKCSYCYSDNVPLVTPNVLAEIFAPVISIYQRNPAGRTLVEWLMKDWGMFSHPKMGELPARALLADVLDDGAIVRDKFAPSERYGTTGLALRWEKLRDELMYTNRYFPDANIDAERLTALLSQLRAEGTPSEWFRARIQQGENAFEIKDMGAPPKRVTSHGRANPPGIPYLYLGSTEETAISEIRPHTGETACVAKFKIQDDLDLIDLRDPKRLISPFVFGDEQQISAMRNDIPFLEHLGQELTRPVLPQGAAIDYVPSQYLCEFIKKAGYHGVIYSSSVSSGMNLALFDPTKVVPGTVNQRRITKVSVSIA